jgi:hypothetical protein
MGDAYSTNTPHSVVNTSRSQTALDDLESLTLTHHHVGNRHTDILERDVAVTVRGVVKAHDRQHAVDGDAGGVMGNENDRLLEVLARVVWVCLSEDNVKLAAQIAGATAPPFLI